MAPYGITLKTLFYPKNVTYKIQFANPTQDHDKMYIHPNRHPYDLVTINGQEVAIDKEWTEIVVWMNTLPGVRTLYCCQGYDEKLPDSEHNHEPYLMYTCDDIKMVKHLHELFGVRVCHANGGAECKSWVWNDVLRFSIRWKDRATYLPVRTKILELINQLKLETMGRSNCCVESV